MAGNSQRKGAMRKEGTKKGSTVGSGGQRRRGLEGKGPTPPGSARKGHPAARRAAAAEKRAAKQPRGTSVRGSGAGSAKEIVAGRNSVVEVLRAGAPVVAVYLAVGVDLDDRVREAVRIAGDRGLPLLESPRAELDRITGGAIHQGLAVQLPVYEYAHPDDLIAAAHAAGEVPLIVALDGVTDPRNLGAVVRSAAAFGAHGVVVPSRRSAGVSAGAWKSSAGALSRVPVARAANLARSLAEFRKQGLFVVGLDGSGETSVGDLDLADGPLVLVVGSEESGLSRVVTDGCDLVASIPIDRATESLNAGVAAGIALYEISRRR
jgi:23S rRNA (guanosine2251-2'-O)-methyltransferase